MEDKSLEKLCTVGELQAAFASLQQENATLQSQITALTGALIDAKLQRDKFGYKLSVCKEALEKIADSKCMNRGSEYRGSFKFDGCDAHAENYRCLANEALAKAALEGGK